MIAHHLLDALLITCLLGMVGGFAIALTGGRMPRRYARRRMWNGVDIAVGSMIVLILGMGVLSFFN